MIKQSPFKRVHQNLPGFRRLAFSLMVLIGSAHADPQGGEVVGG